MSTRRKFIKEVSLASATLAMGASHSFEFLEGEKGPYMATGIKIGEVTANSAILWARLTQNKDRVVDEAPQPIILYKNEATGQFEHNKSKESRPDRVPKVVYPLGANVHSLAGSVPPADGQVRFCWKEKKSLLWQQSPWKTVQKNNDSVFQIALHDLKPAITYDVKVDARSLSKKKTGQSVEGSFSTAPAASANVPITFMVVTCQDYHDRDYGSKGFKIYESMLRKQPNFFVHTGDIIYYDHQAKNIDLARWHWQRMYSFPTLVAFHKKIPSYFMKDDHDTWMNDCWPGKQTRFMGDFTFEQGQQLFLEQVPMGEKTYRTYRWGKHLQVWLPEGRDFRSPNTMPDGPGKTIWGAEQMEWFQRTVQQSDATFKLLISQTPLVGPDRPKKDDNYANAGFYHEGEMLRKFVEEQKMFVVNGDRHWQYASKDPETGLLEFGCGPASTEHAGGWNKDDKRPEHLYLNIIGGYLEVNIDHVNDQPQITFTHHGVEGNVLFEYKHGS